MDLILWRHAEAVEIPLGGDDMARALTSRGEKQAARMAAWLDRQLPDSARIWVSPAKRTEQTALALGRKFRTSPALGPHGTVEELLQLVLWPQAKGCVLVVGHQPLLGQAIAELLGLNASECAVKKGALWWLRHREREAAAQTVVVTVQSPEVL
jgi:phosphohistidine phosphatase|uniref:Phosphohistidine phosphatase SixA n=1 Tax=uncultured bacterium fCS1 TaxID=585280 RepID=C3U0Q0_9BACT|nr:phosphohistidine phosphatase SixA [uncultured bacterium fCS1]